MEDYYEDEQEQENWEDKYDWVIENGERVGYLKSCYQDNPWSPYPGAAEAYEAAYEAAYEEEERKMKMNPVCLLFFKLLDEQDESKR